MTRPCDRRSRAAARLASSAWREVRDEVVGALDPDRQADERLGSTSSGEPATDRWVITAGTSISDSTPPSDSASVNSRVASQIAIARSPAPSGRRRAAGDERDHPAARSASGGAASAACGWACGPSRGPGSDPLDVVAAGEEPGDGQRRSRRGARPAAGASAGRAGRGSSRTARARRPSRSGGSAAARRRVVARDRDAEDRVASGPARYFVAEWKTMSAPRSSGRWSAGDANVLSTTISGRAPPAWAARSRTSAADGRRCR